MRKGTLLCIAALVTVVTTLSVVGSMLNSPREGCQQARLSNVSGVGRNPGSWKEFTGRLRTLAKSESQLSNVKTIDSGLSVEFFDKESDVAFKFSFEGVTRDAMLARDCASDHLKEVFGRIEFLHLPEHEQTNDPLELLKQEKKRKAVLDFFTLLSRDAVIIEQFWQGESTEVEKFLQEQRPAPNIEGISRAQRDDTSIFHVEYSGSEGLRFWIYYVQNSKP